MPKVNEVIKIIIKAGIKSIDGDTLLEDFESYFSMRMSPYLATVDDVRKRVGYHIASVPDDTINQLILQYSLYAENLSNCGIDSSIWKQFARLYVTDMTSLTLLDNHEIFAGLVGGSVDKLLGDFEINKKSPNLLPKNLIDRLQCSLYKLEPAIRECQPPLRDCQGLTNPEVRDWMPLASDIMIRGDNDANQPMTGRRWYPHGSTPQGTDRVYMWGRWYATKKTPWYIQSPNWVVRYDPRYS